MKLRDIIRALREARETLIEEADPIALWAFFNGYTLGNQSAAGMVRALDDDFEGPSSACAFTKAYLLFDDQEAFLRLLDAMERRLESSAERQPCTSAFSADGFVSSVVQAVQAGRAGMMLGEPTLSWFTNCYSGFLAGLEEVDVAEAARARSQLTAFSSWLAHRYSEPGVGWYKILRVYAGPCDSGLRKFAELWEEYIKEGGVAPTS